MAVPGCAAGMRPRDAGRLLLSSAVPGRGHVGSTVRCKVRERRRGPHGLPSAWALRRRLDAASGGARRRAAVMVQAVLASGVLSALLGRFVSAGASRAGSGGNHLDCGALSLLSCGCPPRALVRVERRHALVRDRGARSWHCFGPLLALAHRATGTAQCWAAGMLSGSRMWPTRPSSTGRGRSGGADQLAVAVADCARRRSAFLDPGRAFQERDAVPVMACASTAANLTATLRIVAFGDGLSSGHCLAAFRFGIGTIAGAALLRCRGTAAPRSELPPSPRSSRGAAVHPLTHWEAEDRERRSRHQLGRASHGPAHRHWFQRERPSARSPSARITCMTALISARWVNACGKLPRWRPVRGSISSA